jgi:hypothetical protein
MLEVDRSFVREVDLLVEVEEIVTAEILTDVQEQALICREVAVT